MLITLTKAELADFGRTIAQEVIAHRDRYAYREPTRPPGGRRGYAGQPKTREFALLAALALNLGRVLTREQLLSSAWPDPERVDNRTVDVHVRRVRVALGSAASLIETVHGVGYKLETAPVRPPYPV